MWRYCLFMTIALSVLVAPTRVAQSQILIDDFSDTSTWAYRSILDRRFDPNSDYTDKSATLDDANVLGKQRGVAYGIALAMDGASSLLVRANAGVRDGVWRTDVTADQTGNVKGDGRFALTYGGRESLVTASADYKVPSAEVAISGFADGLKLADFSKETGIELDFKSVSARAKDLSIRISVIDTVGNSAEAYYTFAGSGTERTKIAFGSFAGVTSGFFTGITGNKVDWSSIDAISLDFAVEPGYDVMIDKFSTYGATAVPEASTCVTAMAMGLTSLMFCRSIRIRRRMR